MKKITKLLSVLLAIAVIICPMMSAVVVNAEEPANGYSLTKVNDTTLQLTINSTEGFLVYQATVAFDGSISNLAVSDYELVTGTKDNNNLPRVSPNKGTDTVTFIVASTDEACLDLYKKVVVDITVTSGTTAKLTKIQAADNGDGQDVSSDPTLLDFSGAGVGTDGTVNEDSDYAKEHATPHVHVHNFDYKTNGNGTHNATCLNGCGETITNEACNTDGPEGKCSKCGYKAATEAVEDASLVFASKSPAYSNTGIVLNLRIDNSIYDNYDDVEVVVTPDRYDSKGMRVAEPISYTFKKSLNEFTNAGTSRKNVQVTGFYLYELSLSFSYKINCYDDGKLIKYSPTYTYSIEQWMKETIANVTVADTMKTLCVDTLVVCDAFQTNIATIQYPQSDLAADYATHRVTDNVDLSIATSDIGTCNTIDDFKPSDAAYGTASTATHQVRLSVSTETTPYITIRVADTNSVLDFSKLSITASYTAIDQKGEHPQTKTFNGILSDTNPNGFSKSGKFIQAQYSGIAFPDNCRTITISATYNGTKIFDYEYSLETYEYANKDNASIGAAMTALIKLGKSYRTHNNIA